MRESYKRKELPLVAKALLGVPEEAISREHREELMTLLVSAVAARVEGGYGSIESIKPIVSLMVKLMRKPTFYPVSFPVFGCTHSPLSKSLPLGHGLLRYRKRCRSYRMELDVFPRLAHAIPTFGGRARDIDDQVSPSHTASVYIIVTDSPQANDIKFRSTRGELSSTRDI